MKPFPLARVLQLAERQIETQARAVKYSQGVWLRARGHLVQLTALRDAHVSHLAGDLRAGVSAQHLQARSVLQLAQAADRAAAQAAIDAAYAAWQAQLRDWMEGEKRVRALRLLEQRYLADLAIQGKRIEQRQHDELVELMHGRAMGGRRGR